MAIDNLKSNPDSLDTAMESSYSIVSDPVISEELYKKRQQKKEIEGKLYKIAQSFGEITQIQQNKTRKYYWAITGLCSIQLGIGYHAIENVEWLGWDLVEPLTYTFGHGTFVLGMLIMLRYKNMIGNNYSDMKEDLVDRRIEKILKKEGDFCIMEKDQKAALKDQLRSIEKSI